MIDRYCTEEIKNIWSETNKFKLWVLIEKRVNNELIKYNIIPTNTLSEQLESIDISSLISCTKNIEKEINHDLNAFVFACEELCGKDGRWIHYGLTSSDVLDTANSIMIKESINVIQKSITYLITKLYFLLEKTQNCYHMARTHGQFAEPKQLSTFFSNFIKSLLLCHDDIRNLKVPGKISGAVGNNVYIPIEIEKNILSSLYLDYSKNSTQIVQREYYARIVINMALVATIIEKLALQIRLYQQSGIEEMYEPFGYKQTGSSAMPHKRNPISCENLCGLSRIARSYVAPALENICLWQERDMTHSSVERIILPDMFNVVHFMIERMIKIISGLEINYDKNKDNVFNFGTKYIDSQKEMLELVRKGRGRREAYEIIKQRIGQGKHE